MVFPEKRSFWLLAIIIGFLFMGFFTNAFADQKVEIDYRDGVLKKYYLKDDAYDKRNTDFDPLQVISEYGANLPNDLPISSKVSKKTGDTQQYTGIIRNKTKTDLTVPSQNSAATLVVPANGWIEYSIWRPKTQFAVYRDGNPIRCFDICVHPKCYPYMCKNYDFMAIVEGGPEEKPPYYKKLKKRVRRKRVCDSVRPIPPLMTSQGAQ